MTTDKEWLRIKDPSMPHSDPDGWYDPDKPPRAVVRDKTEDWDKRKAAEAERMETTMEERARWANAASDVVGSDGHRVLRDLDRALAEIARLTAINADLCAVNLRHAEAIARLNAALAEVDEIRDTVVLIHEREATARQEEREACANIAVSGACWKVAAAIRGRPAP